MELTLLFALLWGVLAAVIAVGIAELTRRARMRGRLARMGLAEQVARQAGGFSLRTIPVTVGGWIRPVAPRLFAQLNQMVEWAGYGGKLSPQELLGWKVLGLLLALLLSAPLVNAGGLAGLMLLVLLVSLGWFGVDLWLYRARQARRRAIFLAMPSVVDLLALTLEAGMELDQAVQVVSSKLRNPMGDELQRVLLDRQLGFSQAVAFKRLAERVELDDVRLLGIAIAQAEELGQPMVPVMQNQSRYVRLARRRYAEAEAYRAPIKMMFPMTLFVLPSLFIVVLAPAGLKVAQAMFR